MSWSDRLFYIAGSLFFLVVALNIRLDSVFDFIAWSVSTMLCPVLLIQGARRGISRSVVRFEETLEIHQHEWAIVSVQEFARLATTDLGSCTLFLGTVTTEDNLFGFIAHFDSPESAKALKGMLDELDRRCAGCSKVEIHWGLIGGFGLPPTWWIRCLVRSSLEKYQKNGRAGIKLKLLEFSYQRPIKRILRYGFSIGIQLDLQQESQTFNSGLSSYPLLPVIKERRKFKYCSPAIRVDGIDQKARKKILDKCG